MWKGKQEVKNEDVDVDMGDTEKQKRRDSAGEPVVRARTFDVEMGDFEKQRRRMAEARRELGALARQSPFHRSIRSFGRRKKPWRVKPHQPLGLVLTASSGSSSVFSADLNNHPKTRTQKTA